MQTFFTLLKLLLLRNEQLLLGWLLGLLSPAVVEGIRRRRRVALLRKAIADELDDLRYHMTMTAFVFREKTSGLNDEFLSWVETNLALYPHKEKTSEFLTMFSVLKRMDLTQRSQPDSQKGLAVSDTDVLLLSVHTNEIAQFPADVQASLRGISKDLKLYNQQIAYCRRLFEKTFDNVSDVSRSNIKTNLLTSYGQLAQRATQIANSVRDSPLSLK